MVTRQQNARYAGQDLRETSDKELYGWYAYGLAAETFAVCAVGSFLPVTLEQLARETGVLRSDHTTPCPSSSSKAQPMPSNGTMIAARNSTSDHEHQCIVHPFGSDINTASFAMYTFSLAVFVQAITLVSISAIADHGTFRKRLLLGFAFVGSATGMLFLLVFPSVYLLGSLLVIIGITCLGSSFVLLNSFLPLLVANHPSVQSRPIALESVGGTAGEPMEDDTMMQGIRRTSSAYLGSDSKKTSPELLLSNQISSRGVGIGYTAGVTVQVICIAILITFSKLAPDTAKSTIPLRLILFFVGTWWAVFTIPTALWLRPRPGPPLAVQGSHTWWRTTSVYVVFAWKSLWRTMKIAWQLKQSIRFLIAWFLLSDSIATIQGTAVLFAKTELDMATASIAMISILATGSGIAGAWAWPRITRRRDWNSNMTIIACIALLEVIPVYGMLYYLPFIKSWGWGGLQKPAEIFPMAIIVGFAMGGISSYCRSAFGVLIPPGSEAAFYSLYAFTDKGSSVIGPTIVGSIVDATGSIRSSFWFLAILNAVPIPLIYSVNLQSGREDALAMAKRLGQGKDIEHDENVQAEEGAELLNGRGDL